MLGAVGFVIAVAFSGVPAVWYDEAATVSAATRGIPALFDLVDVVDVVHGVYYGGMQLWFELVGYTPFTLRLPSAVAAGVAVALTVLLVARVGTRRLAILAGLVLGILPRFTWAGSEGRSFALGTALAIGLTLAVVTAVDAVLADESPRRRVVRWVGYGALAAFATALFLYLVLVVVAHLVYVLIAGRERLRALLVPFALAAVGAVAAVTPLVLDAVGQAGQVAWIDPITVDTWHGLIVTQFFPHAPVVAAVAWPLALGGIAVLVRRRRALGRLAALALPWLIVPPLGIVVASVLITPLYSPRYLTFTVPAFAILVAVLLDAIPWRPVAVAAFAALLGVAVPVYVAQHVPTAKQGSTWSLAADLIARESAAIDGDQAVVYGPVRRHPGTNARVIATSYPDAFAGLDDVTSAGPPYGLWERSRRLEPERLAGDAAVWLVTTNLADDDEKRAAIARAGFVETRTWKLDWVHVVLFQPRS